MFIATFVRTPAALSASSRRGLAVGGASREETIDGVSRAVARRAVKVETAEEEWRHFKVERVVAAEGKPHAPVLVRVHSSDGIVHCSCQVFATCNICCHMF